jgi:hypothetical protein
VVSSRHLSDQNYWGSVQITKIYWLRNPKFPNDLSISNAIMVEVRRRILVDRTHGLCSRTSVDDEDDVANLKVNGDLGAMTPVSHEWHLCVLTHVRRSR